MGCGASEPQERPLGLGVIRWTARFVAFATSRWVGLRAALTTRFVAFATARWIVLKAVTLKTIHLPTKSPGSRRRRRGPIWEAISGRWSLFRQSMSETLFDCVSCGACCFSKNPKYLSLLNWDTSRVLPAESLFQEDDVTYVRFDCGHCVHLQLGTGMAVCGVYEDRPEA